MRAAARAVAGSLLLDASYASALPRSDRKLAAATRSVACSRPPRSVRARAARAVVRALLLRNGSPSPARGATGSGRPWRQAPSPASASASPSSARTVRSAVPIPPYPWRTGTAPLRRADSSASASGTETALGPAASWRSRTAIVSRAWSSSSSGPNPPAWLRHSRSACSASAPTAWSLSAPTPVVSP